VAAAADATEPGRRPRHAQHTGLLPSIGLSPVATVAGLALLAGLGFAACSTVSSDGRITIDAPNASDAQFGPVANYLDHRCGSLDCHGQIGRNFRVWGCEGMRLEPGDVPQCSRALGGRPTTPDEHLETYRSLVALEPEIMSSVIADHGQHPELLTFVRKARGDESHKGGTLIDPGDPQDTCITTWLIGNTDTDMCENQASAFPVFPALDASAE
jgi:hypothetical protein